MKMCSSSEVIPKVLENFGISMQQMMIGAPAIQKRNAQPLGLLVMTLRFYLQLILWLQSCRNPNILNESLVGVDSNAARDFRFRRPLTQHQMTI